MIARIPLFVRKFIVDFVETSLGAILALTALGDAQAMAHAILVACGTAVVSAGRRSVPAFLIWLNEELQVPPEE